jgi:hypothetical protein
MIEAARAPCVAAFVFAPFESARPTQLTQRRGARVGLVHPGRDVRVCTVA